VPEVEYKFRNPLMQEATYRTILLRRRREFHQRVGQAMEALFPDRLTELAPRLGHHFAEGGDAECALKYYTLAGDRAARLYANEEAVMHYDRALALAALAPVAPETTARLTHLFSSKGRALELNAQYAEALATYQSMEALATERGDQRLVLAALMAQSTVLVTANALFNPARAEELIGRAQALAQTLGDGTAEAKLLWNMMNVYRFSDRPDKGAEAGERSLALARKLGLREQMGFTLNDLFYLYQTLGQIKSALAANEEARAIWRELGNQAMLADNLSSSVVFNTFGGDLEAAMANAAEAQAISRAIGNTWGIAFSQMGVAIVYWMRGEVGQAIEAMQTTIRYGEQAGFLIGPLWARAQLCMVYCRLGQVERGLGLIAETRARMPHMSSSSTAMAILTAYTGQAYLAAGELEQAQAVLGPATAEADKPSMQNELVGWTRVLLLVAQQAYAEAAARVEQVLRMMRATSTPLLMSDLLLALGRAQVGLGQPETARAALRKARAEAEALQLRWTLWQILAELAPLERAAGQPEEAEAAVRQAREIIDYIAGHIGADDLRDSFLARPEVEKLRMKAEG
jgi:tetratricopeptide (TPR) repeat protein